MNMNGVHAYDANVVKDYQFVAQCSSGATYEVGQELEGIISNVSDKISINFSGKEVKVPSSAVKDAKEGETRTFQIMDISKNGIVLKEVGSAKEQGEKTAKKGLWCTQVDVDTSVLISNEKEPKEEEDANLDKISNQISASDYERLSQEGISLESYELERLERALERVKAQRNEKSAQLELQVEKLNQDVESARKIAKSNISNDPVIQKIVEELLSSNMPITQENILRMTKAMSMLEAVSRMSESTSSYLIRNELPPTIENIYKAVYSSEFHPIVSREETYNQLKDSIESIIKTANIENKEEARSISKWLLNSDLPITADNIIYKKSLDVIKNRINSDVVLQNAVEELRRGNRPESANVLRNSKADFEELVKSIDSIQDATIAKAVEKQSGEISNINIHSLLQLQKQSDLSVLETSTIQESELSAITVMRQLEEIRLKLTYEASWNLSNKGIKVETENLSKVVEELRKLETEYYQNLMKEVSEGTPSEVSLLQATREAVDSIKQTSAYILSDTFSIRHSISLAEFHEVAINSQTRYQHAEASYEVLMTAPRRDMGDSIQKAFASVDSQLNQLGLDLTNSNQRAIRILGYNNMELTVENVVAMKAYDAKVNELLTNLSPSITATMIKDGINPLHIPIDELNEITRFYRKQLGDRDEVKYSEFLVELESNKEITPKEREAYIGIYRLLHQIEASDGAAIGALSKSGKELTLSNLLTEVRTRRRGEINVTINDEAEIKTSTGYNNSITDSINNYYSELTDYNKSIVRSINDEIDPTILSELTKQQSMDINDIPLEQIKEAFQEKLPSHIKQHVRERIEDIQELAKEGKEYISFLKSYEEADNIRNIEAAKYSIENNTGIYEQVISKLKTEEKDKMKRASEKFTKVLDSKEMLQDEFHNFSEELTDSLKTSIWEDGISSEEVKDINKMCDMLRLNANLSQKEYYNIPVAMDDSIINMNLTVIHNSESKGRIRIQLPLEGVGNVTVQASIDNHEFKGYITSNLANGVHILSQRSEELISKLQESGFKVIQLNYGNENISAERFIFSTGNIYKQVQSEVTNKAEVSTSELYVASKVIVEQLTKHS